MRAKLGTIVAASAFVMLAGGAQAGYTTEDHCIGRPATVPIEGYTVNGTDNDDVIVVDDGQDHLIFAAGGDDCVQGMQDASVATKETMYGHTGADVLNGMSGDDILYGEEGPDLDLGKRGDDHMLGMEGADHLDGGPGRDVVHPGPGNDLGEGGPGNDDLADHYDGAGDVLDGGPGNDRCVADRGDRVRNCERVRRV